MDIENELGASESERKQTRLGLNWVNVTKDVNEMNGMSPYDRKIHFVECVHKNTPIHNLLWKNGDREKTFKIQNSSMEDHIEEKKKAVTADSKNTQGGAKGWKSMSQT